MNLLKPIWIYSSNNPIAPYTLNRLTLLTKRNLRVHEDDRLYTLTEDHVTLLEGVSKTVLDDWLDKEFPESWQVAAKELDAKDDRIESLVEERSRLRQQKRFAEADRIRDELRAMGVEVFDRSDGSSGWVKS